MSSGFSLLVVLLSVVNIVAMVWLLWWTRKRRDESAAAPTTGHTWDGDVTEYNNPLPRWWLFTFLISIVFAVAYLILYPGLGNYRGSLGWSSEDQHARSQAAMAAESQRVLAPFASATVAELRSNAAALAVGRNLFADNCTLCHGSDGRGATGFPNLTDREWQWGGEPDSIVTTISAGRTAVMIGWKDVLGGDQGVKDTTAFVLSLSGRTSTVGDAARGKTLYEANCIACHGPTGAGNPLLGAPNLTDSVWLYGGSPSAVRDVIANGRQGQMPAQADKLSEVKIRLLAAYVLSLGDGG